MKLARPFSTAMMVAGIGLGAIAQAQATPRTAFVHLFEWGWDDIATECETFLGPKGFAAVQISPPNKTIDGGQWWTRYQPVSYAFESRSGNREQFRSMVQRCKAAGVDIYLDAVINHMAAWNRSFPEVPYGGNDFHNCTSNIDYSNRWQVQNCDLSGLNDLATESEYVRQKIADYMNDAIGMGVAGFRIDAAKHIPAGDIAAIKSKLNGSPYIFQEVIEGNGEPVRPTEYTYNGDVTEFGFARKLGPAFRDSNIAWLKDLDSNMELGSADAVTFVTNHDEERHNPNGPIWHGVSGDGYFLANIFMLAYPYGYPKIMSGYYFNGDFDAGPPASGVHSGNACGFNGGSWVCEHKWRGIANMVAFRNHTAEQWRITDWWQNGNDQIAFGRGGKGFVVINKRYGSTLNTQLDTGMPDGVYCNIIEANFDEATGTCTDAGDAKGPVTITVSGGKADFQVSGDNAAAIHVGAIVGDPCTGDGCPCTDCDIDETQPVAATEICYDNAAGFSSPSIYYWSATPAGAVENATWPGPSMYKNGGFYCHDMSTELTGLNVIFSDNGADQGADLTSTGSGCYQGGSWKTLQECGFTTKDDEPQPVGESKVCYDNAANFSEPTLYYWNVSAETTVANATWPGVALTEQDGYYCHDFATGLGSLNIIFSDQGANQSDDLTAVAGALCFSNGSWIALANCLSGNNNQGDENWYFRGTPNGWQTSKLDYDADSGLYYTVQSFNGEESPARFKIDDGNWTESYPTADYQVSDYTTYRITFDSSSKQIAVTQQ